MRVAEPWSPPKAFDGMDASLMRRIFDKLRGKPDRLAFARKHELEVLGGSGN